MSLRVFLLAFLLVLPLGPALAGQDLCLDAIRRTERGGATPRGLLGAVAQSESGHRDQLTGATGPWPWTVNNAGNGRYFDTKQDAIAWVEELRAAGKRNIDVGCMQINLMHHPDAFATLDDAFDPAINVAYGARFLAGLQAETGTWERAVERYHTAEIERGAAYRSRVYANWQGGDGGGSAPAGLVPTLTLASVEQPVSSSAPAKFFPVRRLGAAPRNLSAPQPEWQRLQGRRPSGLGSSREAPAPAGLLPVQPAAGPRTAMLAPAPGRIAFMTGTVMGARVGRVAPLIR